MSGTSPIDRIVNNITVRLPGVLEALVKTELFSTLNEFLTETGLWTEEITFEVTGGETSYEVYPEAAAAVIRLQSVTENDIPVAATMPEPGVVRLRNEPSAATEMVATVVLSPNTLDQDDYPSVPLWVWGKYENALIDGVLGRMFMQPAKPYSSERLAIFHSRRFRSAIGAGKSDARRQHLDRGQAWRFPQTFATVR